MNVSHKRVVLLSGGIDSACLTAECSTSGTRPETLFVDYGQPAAERERKASEEVADRLGTSWSCIEVTGIRVSAGEITGRNALLAHLALTWLGDQGAASIYLGIHAGTPYRDCTPEFLAETQRSLDFQTVGMVRLVAPFVSWPKQLVVERAIELEVPIELTHSCECSADPCGQCASCIDRRVALASA